MKIIIAGDWHRSIPQAHTVITEAARQQITTIIQVGDLGVYWPMIDVFDETLKPETSTGFTRFVKKTVQKYDIDFHFVDGNHDNHEVLRQTRDDPSSSVRMDGLKYQPRGSRLRLGGLTFGFLGGAGSIDRDYRQAGIDWWPQEQINPEDLDTLGDERLDVLISHEAPTGTAVKSHFVLAPGLEADMMISRNLLSEAVESTRPSFVFCGHWHQRLTDTLTSDSGHQTVVEVLDCENSGGNAVIFDTDALTVMPLGC